MAAVPGPTIGPKALARPGASSASSCGSGPFRAHPCAGARARETRGSAYVKDRRSLGGKTTVRLEEATGWFLRFAITPEIAQEFLSMLGKNRHRSAEFLQGGVATVDAGLEGEFYGETAAITVRARLGSGIARKPPDGASVAQASSIGAKGVPP
jgi:hypothetical protein